MKLRLSKSILFLLLSVLNVSCGKRSSCDCYNSLKSDLVRDFHINITTYEGNKTIPNVKILMKEGDSWIPPILTDADGTAEIGLDKHDLIDSLYFSHPDYLELKIKIDFKTGNQIDCGIQLEPIN